MGRGILNRYKPAFNEAAVEWVAYYDTSLQTCRIRTPRDKGPVEGLVQKTYNAVYALLHDEVFYNLPSMNARIYELMDGFNEKPSRTTGRSRRDIFEAEEQPTLGKLPMAPYRFRYRKEVKLSGTYHVMVDKHNYSVPYQYVGQKVSVLWDLDTVEVYSGSSRIAIHQRRQGSGYSTLDEHMPDKHLAYKHGQGYNAAYFLEEAALVGSNTTAAVQSILNRTKHVEQSYKSCQGVLSLKRKYGKERLEKACKRLAGCSSITYTTIRNVLEKNLDQVDGEETVSNVPQNDYVRGAEAFMNI